MARRQQEPDSVTARELALFTENDGDIYRYMVTPTIVSFARKKKRCVFDETKALKQGVNIINLGIQKYRKQFGLPPVDKATKIEVAKQILPSIIEQADYHLTNVLCKKGSKACGCK